MIKELMKIRTVVKGVDVYLWPFVTMSVLCNVLFVIELVRLYRAMG